MYSARAWLDPCEAARWAHTKGTDMTAYDDAARDPSTPSRSSAHADLRLENESWEALLRAQVMLSREFAARDSWDEVTQHEYDVLYTLSKAPEGLSLAEVNRDTLMTQGGMSKLVSRLVDRGLVARCPDGADRRAVRLGLTEAGRELQQIVGRRHARVVGSVMRRTLDREQMMRLRDLGATIVTNVTAAET